jgi:diguanylate cyclase (GGDEF)-like protein
MFGNGRKTIGVFVTQVHQEFQETLSRGICIRAAELGYNVAFFTSFLGYGELQYEIGERSIADLPRYENLDGIILLPDTMFSVHGLEERIRDNIAKYGKCPVVSVRRRTEEFYNVLIRDDAVLDGIIRHFIADHGFRRINFLTGPKENPVSMERLKAYRRILEEYGLEYDEERVYYGDFWKYLPYDAVEYWLSKPERLPEAIVCANDYMAITVCNALSARGYSVPGDIAVSGCDNMGITEDFYPTVTTAGMPIYEMGLEAVEKIYKHNEGICQEKDTYLDTVTKIRESCGCRYDGSREAMVKRRNRIINEMEAREKANSNNAFMSVDFTNVKTVDDLDRRLASYIYMNEGFESFYMCLHKSWDYFGPEHVPARQEDDEMIMEAGMKDGEWLQKEEFSRPALLPASQADSDPRLFFFNMLHYQENAYGYTAISFKDYGTYKSSYQGWLINICNALENIRINNKLNQLVYKLEDMYIKDELTDLYNRRALETLGQKYLTRCIESRTGLMVFTADLDKLKYINDNFGHAGGDIAIKAVADALRAAAEDDEICMRVGGDEFVVIGMEYDQKKMDKFIGKFEAEIERFNREEGYDYKVYVSCGWSIIKPSDNITIEDCLLVADSKMYRQKHKNEALRSKHAGKCRLFEAEE